ncbi:DUF4113 domain-containing protein [Pseudomonas viridiflava]|nr:DUF4113 domain-containing protein [Pseudomonas viridiflava]
MAAIDPKLTSHLPRLPFKPGWAMRRDLMSQSYTSKLSEL